MCRPVVDELADARGDDGARAVEQAHEVLAAHHRLAGRGEDLPDGGDNGRGQHGLGSLAEALFLLGQVLAQGGDARVAIAQIGVELVEALADLVDALGGARLVVVGVADEGARLGRLQLDLQRRQPVLDGGIGLCGHLGIAPVAFQRRGRNAARAGHRLDACEGLLGRVAVGAGDGQLAGDLGGAGLELAQASFLEGPQLVGDVGLHHGHVGDARGNARTLALELIDEAGEIIEPTALGAPVDDAQDRVAGLEVRADVDAGRRLDVAFDRGAQRDETGIDHRLGAGRLQQRADRQPADHGQQQQADDRLRRAAVRGPEPGSLLGECIERRFARRRLGGVGLEFLSQALQTFELSFAVSGGRIGNHLR